ncbi:MAG: choice-of-anchor D domain-containing protein, partial [candidate division WOR-3 bacterium]
MEPPEISVTPDSVSDSLFTGETSTKILTINNTGVTDLIFSISLEDLGFKPVIIQDSRFSRANIEKQGALSTTNINRTTSRNETNADFRVLSFPKAPPMADIAILGVEDPRYDAYLENVSEYLVNSGRFASVNTINGYATTPTLAELQTYDAVGVFSWRNWGDPDAIGDVLADYIDSGGNVFVAFAANAAAGDLPIGGRFDSENYWLISPNSYSMSNNYSMGTVLEPDHAIMTGVDSLISRSKLNSEALVSKDATILAEFEDGTPLLAIGRKNNSLRTDISFPFITSATNAAGIDATTDAELLIINAFEWLTNPAWLLTELSSDTVPAGGSVNIEVTFDASQLFGGNYYANIIVSSNDPANPELKIPAHLHVTGAPDISIPYDTLSYGIVFNGYSATDTLIIENNGTDLLTVTNILSDNADYNADITNFSLNPGENRKVPVIFTPSSTGVITGTLSIESNDPDNPTSTVLLQGECMEPPDISVSPLSFSKSLETGETAIDTLTIYNNGLSNLIFNLSTEESWVSTRKTSKNVDNAVSSIIQRSGILESEISINSTKEEQGKNIEKVYKKPEEIANTKYNQGLTPFAGTPSVAIVASAGLSRSFTDVQNKLLATGEFFSVTVIDAQIVTPTTEELQAFDAVLVWKNTIYSNRVSLGNNLADYVDAGGGVVLAVYESGGTIDRMLGGRWESEKYYVIARSTAQTGLQTLGAVAIPAHPIMQGVTSFNGGDASS